MRSIGGKCRSAGDSGERQRSWAVLAIVGLMCTAAGAQTPVIQTGLHDGAEVYGTQMITPEISYTNIIDIILRASGETNPTLYPDLRFYAYGFYVNTNLVNISAIDVNAVGGNATASSDVYAPAWVRGISGTGDVDNSGDVVAVGTGGTATGQDAAEASAQAEVTGIHVWGNIEMEASSLRNTDAIIATAIGGTAGSASADARADATAYALQASYADVNSVGDLTVTAQGGAASAYGVADVRANAYGVHLANSGEMDVAGVITVAAIGGTADANDRTNIYGNTIAHAYADAYAHGLYIPSEPAYPNSVTSSGTITVVAMGGTADADAALDGETSSGIYALAKTVAYAHGIFGGEEDVANTGDIDVSGVGGTAHARTHGDVSGSGEIRVDAFAYVTTNGIETAGEVTNAGDIGVIATGGTAWASDFDLASTGGTADAHADARGIHAGDNVTNTGDITAVATGGTADANGVSLPADAAGDAYGIYSAYGLIANSGQIEAMGTGGSAFSATTAFFDVEDSDASGRAYGIFSDDGAIENAANLNATATGGSATGTEADAYHELFASARAYALYLDGGMSSTYPDRHIINSGDLSVTAVGGDAQGSVDEANASAWAYGIASRDAPVVNSGSIMAAATGGNALSSYSLAEDEPGAYANATAYGIKLVVGGLNNSDVGDLNNSGAITVSGTGGTATGQGGAEASARAEVHGIYVEGTGYVWGDPMSEGKTEVENSAPITIGATGGTVEAASTGAWAEAEAFGLLTHNADVDNSGDIIVTAQGGVGVSSEDIAVGASAYGMSASSGNVANSGNITVTAIGGTGTAGDDAQAFLGAYATGLALSGTNTINAGDIVVTAHGGSPTGDSAHAEGISLTASTLNNSGNITATATAMAEPGSSSYAYGINSGGYNTLTNAGVIRAIADTSFEVYVFANTTTLADIYNVTLDGDPNQASVGVANGATLALNHAKLTVTAIDGETLWDTEYRLFETQGAGVVDGNFADVQAVNPNTTATYHDQGTIGSVDDTVSLAYTPGGSPTLASSAVQKQAIAQAADAVNHHVTATLLQNILSPSSSGLLASAGSTAESLALAEAVSGKSAGVFVEPYYSFVDKDANPLGYDARLWGFSAGYERFLGNTLLALHLGYGQSDINYSGAGYRGNREEQDIVTAGFSGLTRWDPWLLRYGLTGFYGNHDYQGLTGLALDEQETADYDSYGLAATLMAGRIFRCGSHVLLPEAGLNWLWAHRQRYTTEATDPAWDTTYSAMDDHDLQAVAALRWLSSFVYDEIRVTPSAAIGVRHLLTDAEASAWQSVPGAAPVLVRSEQDRTAMTLSGSVTLTRTRHALSLAYDGEYSPDTQRHNLWLRYSWLF